MTKTSYNFKKAIIQNIKKDNLRREERGEVLIKLTPHNIDAYARQVFEYMDENIEYWLDDLIGQAIYDLEAIQVECKIKECLKPTYEQYGNVEKPYCQSHYDLFLQFEANKSYSKAEVEN